MNENSENIYSFCILRFIYYYQWYRICYKYIVYSFENDTKNDGIVAVKGLSLGGFLQEIVILFGRNYLAESVGKRSAGKETAKESRLSFSCEKNLK